MQFIVLAGLAAGAAGLHLGAADKQRTMIEKYLQRPGDHRPEGVAPGPVSAETPVDPTTPGNTDSGAADGSSGAAPENSTGGEAPFNLESLGEMITVDQALHIYNLPYGDDPDPPSVVFIDARERDHYLKGHIPAAYHITPQSFVNDTLPADMEFWPKDSLIVVYCSGGDCDASHLVRTRLIHERLFPRVFIMEAGLPGWIKAQLPTEPGEPPN
jgi:rhodanese-related sulfurtransferase